MRYVLSRSITTLYYVILTLTVLNIYYEYILPVRYGMVCLGMGSHEGMPGKRVDSYLGACEKLVGLYLQVSR